MSEAPLTPDPEERDDLDPTDDGEGVPFTTEQLVEALRLGDPPSEDDDLAAILAAWRTDVTSGLDLTPAAPRPATPRPLAPVLALNPPRCRPRRRLRRATTAAAAATVITVIMAGGVAAGSWRSTPQSPLWPVARVLYPQHADTIAIEHTIAQARNALHGGHPELAAQLINTARHQLAAADLPDATADRLRAAIDALVLDLAAFLTGQHVDPPTVRLTTSTPAGPAAPPSTAAAPAAPAKPAVETSPKLLDGLLSTPPKLPLLPKLTVPPVLPGLLTTPTPTPTPSASVQSSIPDADVPKLPALTDPKPQPADRDDTPPTGDEPQPPRDDRQDDDGEVLPDLDLPLLGGLLN